MLWEPSSTDTSYWIQAFEVKQLFQTFGLVLGHTHSAQGCLCTQDALLVDWGCVGRGYGHGVFSILSHLLAQMSFFIFFFKGSDSSAVVRGRAYIPRLPPGLTSAPALWGILLLEFLIFQGLVDWSLLSGAQEAWGYLLAFL